MLHRRYGPVLVAVLGVAVVLAGAVPASATVTPTPSPDPATASPSPLLPGLFPTAAPTTGSPSTPAAPVPPSPAPTATSIPLPTPVPIPLPDREHSRDTRLASLVPRDQPPGPPTDGIAPDLGQVDEFLDLTARRSEVLTRLEAARAAVVAADQTIASLVEQVSAAATVAANAQTEARFRQGAVEDVARELYQQGDGGLGAIATLLSPGPGGLIGRLNNIDLLTSAADDAVVDAISAKADVALAQARKVSLDLALTQAQAVRRTTGVTAEAARVELAEIDARLRELALVPPQAAIGPDGCPTADVTGTLREGAELVGAAALCRSAIAQAATPQAALAITWAFARLGAAYACKGVGRLLPYRADCSSFVARAFHEGAGLDTSGAGWAPSTRNMVPWDGVALDPHYAYVEPVALRPGDLVTYDTCPQGGCPYKHVVMYLGSNDGGTTHWMAHTNSCGDVAKVERFWGFPTTGSHTFLVARRVLALPGEQLLPAPTATPAAAPSPSR